MGWIGRGLALAAGALLAGPNWGAARAGWMEASSPHFLIYADMSEKELRKQALDLERFDMAMRRFQRMEDTAESRANRVIVYFVRDPDALQRLCRCQNVYGMYKARVGGAVAFSPRSADVGPNSLGARTVLFHEYAHHFMLGSYDLVLPPWFTEGHAEFMSTAVLKDGTALLGSAAQHRAYSLLSPDVAKLTARELFDTSSRRRMNDEQVESLYARGWLLTHYLSTDAERYRQLRRYLAAINGGTPSLKAAEATFGDLRALDRALNSYVRNRLTGFMLKNIDLPATAVTVRPLSAGPAAMMEYRIRSTYGVDPKSALPLYKDAGATAARFPDDPLVQGWFAEIAWDAGRFADAGAAADRALAKDPNSIQALLYKARTLSWTPDATDAGRAQARKLIVRANRVDNNAAEPLWMYYLSFDNGKSPPTPAAKIGLYRASQLVPQDPSLRIAAAVQHIRDGELAEAKRALTPVAYAPHADPDNRAAKVVAAIDAGKSQAEVLAVATTTPPEVGAKGKPGAEPPKP